MTLQEQKEKIYLHCAEPLCPECNKKAYERGKKDGTYEHLRDIKIKVQDLLRDIEEKMKIVGE